jgi:hypothetical protein
MQRRQTAERHKCSCFRSTSPPSLLHQQQIPALIHARHQSASHRSTLVDTRVSLSIGQTPLLFKLPYMALSRRRDSNQLTLNFTLFLLSPYPSAVQPHSANNLYPCSRHSRVDCLKPDITESLCLEDRNLHCWLSRLASQSFTMWICI